MQVGDLVVEGLSQYIGIITVVDKMEKGDLTVEPAPTYFVHFFDTYDGENLNDWYTDGDLEVVCK